MKNDLMTNITRIASRTGIKIKKYSPEIFLGLGIVGIVSSTILACKQTMKINEIKEETKELKEKIDRCLMDETIEYSEEDAKNDLKILKVQTTVKYVKLYAGPIILGTVSLLSIIQGHHILKKRNVAIAAAYTALDKGFKQYRKNVVERFGEVVDKELKYGLKSKQIEVEKTNEKGKTKTEKEEIKVVNREQVSEFARFFDEYSPNWTKDPEYNLMYLRRQQDYANEMLKIRGHMFLNEVYDILGMKRSRAGQVVGWIYDKNNNNPNGDNYIDFGVYDIDNERKRAFVNGYEKSILLDFNVDGVIYDLI